MYLKWIICKVSENLKEEFSKAQSVWSEINIAKGFLFQAGGWNLNNDNEACILSAWNDKESYFYFMDNIHDEITAKNNQQKTYESISVEFYINDFDLKNLNEIVKDSNYFKLLSYSVKPLLVNHFENVLKSSLKIKPKEKINIILADSEIDPDKYLYFSFWKDQINYQNFINNHPDYSNKQKEIIKDLSSAKSYDIVLEDSWKTISISQ